MSVIFLVSLAALLVKQSNVPLTILLSSSYPLIYFARDYNQSIRCLGIEDKKGTLRAGAHADLVVLDRQGTVLSTWVKGKQVWARNV